MTPRVAAALLVLVASTAGAVRHRRPFHPGIGLGYGFDNNGNAGGCVDYACGGKCYNTHTGSDFPLGFGTEVIAGAPGTVVAAVQGCADYGYYGNPCGGQCGNHVKIKHADGTYSLYCHMRNGSLAVSNGQYVGCGQTLGNSASSGSSTGPHLHFGWQPNGSRDPFAGSCSGSPGGWVDQGGYNGTPGSGCEVQCDCSPGQQQQEGCGRCGYRVRTCNGDCHWGGWSGCQGEGPCNPGAVESQACCDCGSQSRSCQGNCQWGGFGACNGPDPAGSPACDTGKLGDCAAGVVRCISGCRTCADLVLPSPELCDGHDSDCDGPIDEDATELGTPPPAFAAELLDLSIPAGLRPGEQATVWALFQNVGTAPWPESEVWLEAHGPDGAPSPFADVETWSAYDVATVVAAAIAPGETAAVSFPVRMPADYTGAETRFDLVHLGTRVPCPSAGFALAPTLLPPVAVELTPPVDPPATLPDAGPTAPDEPDEPDVTSGSDLTPGAGSAGEADVASGTDDAATTEPDAVQPPEPTTDAASSTPVEPSGSAGGCGTSGGGAPPFAALLALLALAVRRHARPR